ncbi:MULTISPECIES: hybrid sensor histidine kinase/response regulator [Pseudomonas]|uniref:hybrid sensor histidine kinase/response regulator n=1 Tax=Pseudomonas TaxID=286 RepID=UPI001C60C521|nr:MULTISPECIES: hybrid sensor histidine kinase/response regulator [Pseudomonas]MBW5412855.1 response regulator [Pseudomonas sp. MAG002Y]MCG7375004.1 hybrid sensor histidine kinase/response regulator [Pseudomonas luteola]
MLKEVNTAKILIVDDLPENLLALEALLKHEDLSVFKAGSAEAALELLLVHEFALAILDVQMPVMNGFELAEMMRSTEKTKHIPIVFVSAAGHDRNYAFKGYESGAVDFLYKPLDIHAVKSKVSVFVDLYRHRKGMRRQLEALERSRQEQEVLLAELRQTQVELQHAVRMRDDFMSIVSHELKTPLNTLILEAQLRKIYLGKNNMAAFTPEKLMEMVERDERQVQKLVRLIDDMLDVSRIRTGKLSIRPSRFDLVKLVSSIVENFMPQLNATGCDVTVELPEYIEGEWDEFRIEQVVANLLTNAMRYGAGKPVHVKLDVKDGCAVLSVRDFGIGISPENQERIFRQFERASGSEGVAGLGLGLYIADQIVKAHRGTIGVCSIEGQGATFSVTLPLGESTATESAKPRLTLVETGMHSAQGSASGSSGLKA